MQFVVWVVHDVRETWDGVCQSHQANAVSELAVLGEGLMESRWRLSVVCLRRGPNKRIMATVSKALMLNNSIFPVCFLRLPNCQPSAQCECLQVSQCVHRHYKRDSHVFRFLSSLSVGRNLPLGLTVRFYGNSSFQK